jgi:hypothetical protein
LLASRTGGVLTLCWPSAAAGFVLQQTTNLTTPVWTAVSESVQTNGVEKWVNVSASAQQQYFRLVTQ